MVGRALPSALPPSQTPVHCLPAARQSLPEFLEDLELGWNEQLDTKRQGGRARARGDGAKPNSVTR